MCSTIRQLLRSPTRPGRPGSTFDRKVFVARKRAERGAVAGQLDVYFPSLSSRTLVYEGVLTTPQLALLPDLEDEGGGIPPGAGPQPVLDEHVPVLAAARPYRFIAHNGEINTVQATATGCAPVRRCSPATCSPAWSGPSRSASPDGSDSASFDEVLELLRLGGRWLPPHDVDDDPRGVGEQPDDGPGEAGRSTASTPR